jgi:aerobic-type carbon monoxide dehydrogenase small subunit (CoxS/CutS family)
MRLERGVERPAAIAITVDGERVEAYEGESLAAVLLASGRRVFRRTASGEPRAPYCNMGVCFDCVVAVDGERLRACVTPTRAGMQVRTDGGD